MARPDLEKRRAFACAYAELGNAAQAALRAGVPQSSAHSMGYRWLRDERVVAMVREQIDQRLKSLGPIAVQVIEDIMLSQTAAPQTRLQAARDVLDRLGWVPPKRADLVDDAFDQDITRLSVTDLERIAANG